MMEQITQQMQQIFLLSQCKLMCALVYVLAHSIQLTGQELT